MAEKHAMKKLVEKVLHPHAEAKDQEKAQGKSKPQKPGKANPAEDFQQHPKFAKFKGRA